MTRIEKAYTALLDRLAEIHALNNALGLLSWDQETLMPPKGVESRALSRQVLSGLAHDRITAPELGDLLDALSSADLDAPREAVVRECRRDRDRAVKVPRDLVTEIARVTALSQQAWAAAREADDYPAFAPRLAQVIDLRRRQAEALGYEGEPYNALLDEYEPGTRVEDLEPVFDGLRNHLIFLVAEISGKPQPGAAPMTNDFPVDAQERFCRRLLVDMGFDFEAGRLDRSAHPFTSEMGPRDVRLTTNYDPADLGRSVYSTIHEGGHGLYEQGLPTADAGTPLGEAVSLGIHESQSRLWENMIARGRPFMDYALPLLRDVFPGRFDALDGDDLYRSANIVRPSLIRIEADEVTYNLHIILRMELERAVISGDLQVDDLPGAWNDGMLKYLGLTPPTDREGVLQDIHWSFGLFGYFPTYTLGNLYAAQFFDAARTAIPDLDARTAAGDFAPLLDWLRGNIHRHGRLHAPGELCRMATGRDLDAGALTTYLDRKFGGLYGLERGDDRV